MALTGSLENFGLANIFQLLGQGQKTGLLTVNHGEEEVRLFLAQGAIIRCETSSRERRQLLGAMLVRAEVITEEQLERALEIQKAERRRLGDCLVRLGAVEAGDLAEFTRLQTNETLLRTLLWRDGRYTFNATAAAEAHHSAIRVEHILMEAFRQTDEWPAIRRVLTSYATTFRAVRSIDAYVRHDISLPTQIEGEAAEAPGPQGIALDAKDRLVYSLITPTRDLQKLVDLSRLGEFETMRSLVKLLSAGLIAADHRVAPQASGHSTVGGIDALPGLFSRRISYVGAHRALGTLGSFALLCVTLASGLPPTELFAQSGIQSPVWAWRRALGAGESHLIATQLEVYNALYGRYPEGLAALETTELLPSGFLTHTFKTPWVYAPAGESYQLAQPLY